MTHLPFDPVLLSHNLQRVVCLTKRESRCSFYGSIEGSALLLHESTAVIVLPFLYMMRQVIDFENKQGQANTRLSHALLLKTPLCPQWTSQDVPKCTCTIYNYLVVCVSAPLFF